MFYHPRVSVTQCDAKRTRATSLSVQTLCERPGHTLSVMFAKCWSSDINPERPSWVSYLWTLLYPSRGLRADLLRLAELYFSYPVSLEDCKGVASATDLNLPASNATTSTTATPPVGGNSITTNGPNQSIFEDNSLGWKLIVRRCYFNSREITTFLTTIQVSLVVPTSNTATGSESD